MEIEEREDWRFGCRNEAVQSDKMRTAEAQESKEI
jgi:hypothetical protein